MFRTRPLRARRCALPLASPLSVLAVLAFACSPALAQAEEATGPVYESEVPNVPGEQGSGPASNGGSHQAEGGGNAGKSNVPQENGTGGGNGPGAGGGSHTGQGNQGPDGNGGQSPGGDKRAGGAIGENKPISSFGANASNPTEDESSSPLVPILIAIVVLAAISIGAFYYRQRRQAPGSSPSPKAS
jgi:hypothetical protein